ncbi:unnamed protein product [Orchesella dallaii]|uniref:Uncharacterized protein n=1 Tax=Orchesella dallaii TaxID=48710 RepID=A0ABP1S9H9_9HEXA
MAMPIYKRKMCITKLVIGLLRWAVIKVIPFLFGLLAVLFPFLPTNMLSFYPTKVLPDVLGIISTKESWIYKVSNVFLAATLNGLSYGIIVKVGMLCVVQILVIGVSLSTYIGIIITQLQNLKKSKAKLRSLKYEKGTNNIAFIYKEIQLLVGSFNRIHSKLLITILVVFLMVLVLWAVKFIQFLVIGKFGDPRFLSMNVLIVEIVLNCVVVIILLYGTCGDAHDASVKCLEEMKWYALHSGSRRKIILREMRALPVLKIEFGTSNFIGKTTPFVYLQFALIRIIDCLLLSKG